MTQDISRFEPTRDAILNDINKQVIEAIGDLASGKGLNIEDFTYDIKQALKALKNIGEFIEFFNNIK